MFASRTPQRLLLITVLLAAQLGGCAPGLLQPAPVLIEVEGAVYEVRRHGFLSRGGFVRIAPAEVRPAGPVGFTPQDRDRARRVLDGYCRRSGFDPGPQDTSYWTTDGRWHFVQGCLRPV